MTPDALDRLHQEVAGMRVVLVHMLARLPQADIVKIAESASRDLQRLEVLDESVETAMIPYRAAVDDLFGRALQIRESEGPDDPRKDP